MNEHNQLGLWPVKRALISVWDKAGLLPLAQSLAKHGIEIVASLGTATYLRQAGLTVIAVEEVTEKPQAFGGRVKTLGFPIASGILYHREKASDLKDAAMYQVSPYDLVVVNLYPFQEKKELPLSDDELIEYIDIGGPTLLRAAAKNSRYVCALPSVHSYEKCQQLLQAHQGSLPLSFRKEMAVSAFGITAAYDQCIFGTLAAASLPQTAVVQELSRELALGTITPLRYGENPHQQAYLVGATAADDFSRALSLQGKELSYNNWPDAYAAWALASDLFFLQKKCAQVGPFLAPPHAVVVVKHQNPCGAALGADAKEVLMAAWQGDEKSSFGSVVAFSTPPTLEAMEWLLEHFVEVVVLPYADEALLQMCQRKKNLRVMIAPPQDLQAQAPQWEVHSLQRGFLLQTKDVGFASTQEWKSVTQIKFPLEKYPQVAFGLEVLKYLKSNAIGIFAQTCTAENAAPLYSLLASGMGLTNRIEALTELALPKAKAKKSDLRETVCLSEAFFPFADVVEEMKKVPQAPCFLVQPGGAMRDEEVIASCDQAGISMLFTGRRHFRH